MAIEPVGAPRPVKLAIAPLAAAQEVVRLTQEQNQRIRESQLEVDQEARQARQAAEAAQQASRDDARDDTTTDQPANDAPSGETRGETVDILA